MLHQKLNILLGQINELRKCSTIDREEFYALIEQIKNEMKELTSLCDNQFIKAQVHKLSEYVTYDELSFTKKALMKLVYLKAHLDWIEKWNARGKYLSDLDSIQQTIDGILFNFKTDTNNAEHS